MRSSFFALALCACSASRAPQTVSLEARTAAPANAITKTVLRCTIIGTGERLREGELYPFRLYAANDARAPVFVIERPELAHVTWQELPERPSHDRARISIGGQSHVRYEGFADTYGRTFTLTRRMESVAGHLWAHAGAPAYVLSARSNGDVFVAVETPFKAPHEIIAQGNCSDLAYAPVAPERAAKERRPSAAAGTPFRVYASENDARPFTTVSPSSMVALDVVSRGAERVHVTGDEGWVGFDAWVPASDVVAYAPAGSLPHEHRPREPRVEPSGRRSRVLRDAQLFLEGEGAPEPLRGGIVERGALVVTREEDGPLVAFEFVDDMIAAPEGQHLWIAKDVVSLAP